MSIEVKRAAPQDFLAIAELDRQAWTDTLHGEHIPDGEHTWRIWCEYSLTYVAFDGDTLVGAIVAFGCEDGRYCVHKVMVSPACRGQGVGTRLFEHLLDKLDQQGATAFLTVSPGNEAAVRLYARWGFVDRTFHQGFYREDEDRFVLARRSVPK